MGIRGTFMAYGYWCGGCNGFYPVLCVRHGIKKARSLGVHYSILQLRLAIP